jgi:hypothetical protein
VIAYGPSTALWPPVRAVSVGPSGQACLEDSAGGWSAGRKEVGSLATAEQGKQREGKTLTTAYCISHSRPKGDRQLDDLSEAFKLTRISADGSERPMADRTEGECRQPGGPGGRRESERRSELAAK